MRRAGKRKTLYVIIHEIRGRTGVMPPDSDPRDPPDDRPTDQLPALISATSVAFTTPLPDGNLIPALIADLGDEAALALCRILHRQHPQPEHAPGLCPGVQPVLRLVRTSAA